MSVMRYEGTLYKLCDKTLLFTYFGLNSHITSNMSGYKKPVSLLYFKNNNMKTTSM